MCRKVLQGMVGGFCQVDSYIHTGNDMQSIPTGNDFTFQRAVGEAGMLIGSGNHLSHLLFKFVEVQFKHSIPI